jgi:hypothetical protein
VCGWPGSNGTLPGVEPGSQLAAAWLGNQDLNLDSLVSETSVLPDYTIPHCVRHQGLEPRTCCLRGSCSAIELVAPSRHARNRTALLLVPGQAGHHFPFMPFAYRYVELERFELSSTCLQGRRVSARDLINAEV